MEVFTHVLLFFIGMALYHLLRRGLARSSDSTDGMYFVSATITFKNHKGSQTEHQYAGTFKPTTRNPSEMAEEFKKALLKLTIERMPEEIFQLSDSDNYYIQIYSMNKV